MAYDYLRFRSLATRLLVKYGQAVQLTLKAPGVYDNGTSVNTLGTPVSKTVHAVFKRPGLRTTGAAHREEKTLIQFGEWDVVLSAEECGSLPKSGDTILRDGQLLLINLADEARPGSIGLVYFCKLVT